MHTTILSEAPTNIDGARLHVYSDSHRQLSINVCSCPLLETISYNAWHGALEHIGSNGAMINIVIRSALIVGKPSLLGIDECIDQMFAFK